MYQAPATRSAMLEENVVLVNSPSLAPSPVKSKRSTAMPRAVSAWAMRFAARLSLPQVKQCANSANATGSPAGLSSSAESFSPRALGKSKRSDGIASSLLLALLRRCTRLEWRLFHRLLRQRRMGPPVLPDHRADH